MSTIGKTVSTAINGTLCCGIGYATVKATTHFNPLIGCLLGGTYVGTVSLLSYKEKGEANIITSLARKIIACIASAGITAVICHLNNIPLNFQACLLLETPFVLMNLAAHTLISFAFITTTIAVVAIAIAFFELHHLGLIDPSILLDKMQILLEKKMHS